MYIWGPRKWDPDVLLKGYLVKRGRCVSKEGEVGGSFHLEHVVVLSASIMDAARRFRTIPLVN